MSVAWPFQKHFCRLIRTLRSEIALTDDFPNGPVVLVASNVNKCCSDVNLMYIFISFKHSFSVFKGFLVLILVNEIETFQFLFIFYQRLYHCCRVDEYFPSPRHQDTELSIAAETIVRQRRAVGRLISAAMPIAVVCHQLLWFVCWRYFTATDARQFSVVKYAKHVAWKIFLCPAGSTRFVQLAINFSWETWWASF